MKDNKPTVFISCGQTKGSREERIALKIKAKLRNKYNIYIASEEQTTKGLLNNIFDKIRTAEYFLFIDFKRRKSSGADRSIYANQELAIAGFEEIDDIIAFQEKGLKSEGMQKAAMQLNPTVFLLTDEQKFVKTVCDKVRSKWPTNWKNKLDITDIEIEDDVPKVDGSSTKYYQLRICNLHRKKDATNCFGYIDSIYDLDKKSEIKTRLVEIKWEGTIIPNIKIFHQTSRKLDACFYYKHNSTKIWFSSFSDSRSNLAPIPAGNYKITFSVASDNFYKASKEVFLEFKDHDWLAHF
jgi:hypothetical protein